MLNGFVKLHRQICDWQWYQDANMFRIFLHLLLNANFEKNYWKGTEVKRGQLITSYQHISEGVGVSVHSVRTALGKLEKTGEIKAQTTNKFTMITICKFDSYQSQNDTNGNQGANNWQTNGNQGANDWQQRKKEEERKEEEETINKEGKIENEKPFLDFTGDPPMWYCELLQFPLFKTLANETKQPFLDFCKYRHDKETKGIITQTVIQILKQFVNFLKDHPEKLVIESLDYCIGSNNVNFNPLFVINYNEGMKPKAQQKTDISTHNFPYQLPTFENAAERERYFFVKFEFYKEQDKDYKYLQNRLINTEYRKLAYEQRKPEQLIIQLETEFPNLLQFKYPDSRWKNTAKDLSR